MTFSRSDILKTTTMTLPIFIIVFSDRGCENVQYKEVRIKSHSRLIGFSIFCSDLYNSNILSVSYGMGTGKTPD